MLTRAFLAQLIDRYCVGITYESRYLVLFPNLEWWCFDSAGRNAISLKNVNTLIVLGLTLSYISTALKTI